MLQKSVRLPLAVALLVFLWAYSWLTMKQGTVYIAPALFTSLRGAVACVILFTLVLIKNKKTAKIPPGHGIAIGLFQIAGMQGFSQLALSYGDAGKVSVLVYTMPVWLTLFSSVFLRERFKNSFYIQAFFVVIGLLLLMHPWQSKISYYSCFFALLAGVCWAYGSVLAKKLYQRQPDIDLLKFTAFQMLVTAVAAGFIEVVLYQPGSFVINSISIYTVLYNGVVASAGGWWLMAYILKLTPPGKNHLSLMLVPVVGLILSVIFLKEQLVLIEVAGISLILLMCLLNKIMK